MFVLYCVTLVSAVLLNWCVCVCVCVSCRIKVRELMKEGDDGYFSGDQIPVFICKLLLCHRLPRNVSGLLSLM